MQREAHFFVDTHYRRRIEYSYSASIVSASGDGVVDLEVT